MTDEHEGMAAERDAPASSGAAGAGHSADEQEDRARSGEPRRGRAASRRSRRILVLAALVVVVLVVAFVLLGAARQVLAARAELQSAAARTEAALGALRDARVDDALDDLRAAEAEFTAARGRVRGPLVRIVGTVPYAGRQVAAVDALAGAGAGSAQAGRLVLERLEVVGGLDGLLPANGALPVDAYAALVAPMGTAADLVRQAGTEVDAIQVRGLAAPVAEAREQAATRLDDATALLDELEPLVAALPKLLGSEGPRRYFFAASNPAEMRGSTGFMGAWSILTLDDGRFAFDPFRPIQDLPDAPPGTVAPPSDEYETRYERFGGAAVWKNLSVSPDFPIVGTAIERLWDATTEQPPLDGVISADPFVLAALAEVTGPVAVPPAPGEGDIGAVAPSDIVDFLTNEAYGRITDPEARKRLLGDVAASTVQSFLAATADADRETAIAVARQIGEAARGGHLTVHARDSKVQEGVLAAGIGGAVLNPAGDYFAAFFDGTTSSKIDYYLERELDYRVTLDADGTMRAEAELRLHNTAPTEGEPYVVGPNAEGLVAGQNALYAAAFLDGETQPESVEVTRDGAPVDFGGLQREAGHPIVETFESLLSGSRATLVYAMENPDGWAVEDDGFAHYRLMLQAQAAITPQRVRVEVRLPPGARPVDLGPEYERTGEGVIFTTELSSIQGIHVPFTLD